MPAAPRRYWLMKSEPDVFSIQDLARAPRQTTFWDSVRNYQARNFLRDQIKPGDGVLYYHSNASPSAVVGTATVVGPPRPDPSQWDPDSEYHDPDSPRDSPRWYGVDIKLDRIFPRPLPIDELRRLPALESMVLFKRARLSVQPVSAAEWKAILERAGGG